MPSSTWRAERRGPPSSSTMRRTRSATFPITFVRREPQITLDKDCDPLSIARNQTTECTITITNDGLPDATVEVRDELPSRLSLVPGSVEGAEVVGNGVRFSGTLAGQEPPGVEIAAGGLGS